jgi:pantetheine-phosphate adenylyltransferase
MKTAIFPGSFDPFTIGHFDVLQRALQLFDKVIIAVGNNHNKQTLFTAEERAAMIAQAVEPFGERVAVAVYGNLTVDFCHQHQARFIVRGIRTASDFDFENIAAQTNYKLAPDIQSLFFPSHPEHTCICSSVVRDVLLHGGDVSAFIPQGMTLLRK